MKILNIASGSKGNCYRVSDGQTVLMIECGITFKKIQEAFEFELFNVEGLLISHEHGDHCKALKQILNKTFIECYMSQGTSDKLELSGLDMQGTNIVRHKQIFKVGSFDIMPFNVNHDAYEPLGFLIVSGKEKLLFATDTFYLNYKFPGLTHIMLECNYSEEILEENVGSGLVNEYLRDRVKESHFSLENVKEFFKANDLTKVKEIHLLHLSGNNSDPELFKKEIQKLTGVPTYIKEK